MSDKTIVYNCSPTLAGLKTGTLFNCKCSSLMQLNSEISHLNSRLFRRGVMILPVKIKNGSASVYVYRKSQLEKDLSSPIARRILDENGYPKEDIDDQVMYMISRIRQMDDFPHEIGLFLGYPAADVDGYIKNEPDSCKATGYWKVYSDVDEARRCFDSYRNCKDLYIRRWHEGNTLENLTVCTSAAV